MRLRGKKNNLVVGYSSVIGRVFVDASANAGEKYKMRAAIYPTKESGPKRYLTLLSSPDGQPLPGFSLTDCDRIYHNNIRKTVTWKSQSRLSELAGKPIRMRLVMRDCKLYAFQFVAKVAVIFNVSFGNRRRRYLT